MHFLPICLLFLAGVTTSTYGFYSHGVRHPHSDLNYHLLGGRQVMLNDPYMSPCGIQRPIGGYGPKCYYDNIMLHVGERYQPPNSCQEVSCAPGGITRFGNCEPINVPFNCRLGFMDLSKPFPYCCVRELICLK